MTIKEIGEMLDKIDAEGADIEASGRGTAFVAFTITDFNNIRISAHGVPELVLAGTLDAMREFAAKVPPKNLTAIFEAFNAEMDNLAEERKEQLN